ncbi:PrkA family serine protein kinase [Halohasta litorea]|uniref:PrkA family serine protein kinase n=1 Tax=Halohasta litorea TaxID=869891 RepID=A0ABD6D728_9EURY|nr:kinase anchor protein [Halohasta litorea]
MSEDYITAADRQLQRAYEGPMSLDEYVEAAFESPSIAAHASRYLLAAIESMGTRTVIEEGEERERYRFFDDPHNDGEHAVLGNTAVLNAFVDDLRTIAANRGKGEKIIWFDGPTATGKSELKRCLVNGLREYSKTPEGRRYTLEWNITGADNSRGLSYGDEASDDEQWYESPVQVHPLTIFPKSVREDLLARLNEVDPEGPPIVIDGELDPFSREAYDYLESNYRQAGTRKLFSSITDRSHLRVTNYIVDVGRGIGILHSEDDGSPKERLVGSWMPGMLRELDSRGRKNPQAFSYDGVLSQGNSLLTVVEDASQHADLLRKLLNVPDEGRVKLDKGIGMDIDTQLVMISNPDLDAELDQYADRNGRDPLKALKRRLDRHEFRYLTNRRLEAELIRRELTAEKSVWADLDDEEIERRVRAPLSIAIRDGRGETRERELAPFAIGAAAMYSVVSRLDGEELPSELSLIEKARLFEQGYLQDGDDRRSIDAFEITATSDGTHGIPVTYTRDIIADLLHEETGRGHPDHPVENVVMPEDVLNAMAEELSTTPVFSRAEAAEYENRLPAVKDFVLDQQEDAVLQALLSGKSVSKETVAEYVEHVYAWEADSQIETERGRVDPDPLLMKVFETEHLGRFDSGDYRGNAPSAAVEEFRREKVITALNRYAWEHRDEGFSIDNVDLTSIPVIRAVLESYDWADVKRIYPEFDPRQWEEPPTGTVTEQLKDDTIATLCEGDYSPASAELTTRAVMREVQHKWD